MFVWIASYPKSGNTLVRALIAAYFFSNDGIFNFDLLKNFTQFPNLSFFLKLGLDPKDEEKIIKNYQNAQDIFNKRKSIQFIKTHSALLHGFTSSKQTLGAIYIVRDPRKVAVSYANHFNLSLDKATDEILSNTTLGGIDPKNNKKRSAITHLSSWQLHYKSWQVFDKSKKRFLLIKYEDLVKNTEETLYKILKFVHVIMNRQFVSENSKIQNIIKSTSFDNLQRLEKTTQFPEKAKFENEQKTFFKYGPKSLTVDMLDENLKKKIEFLFSKEMLELGYL